jgi:arylsulfatase A-like enzyme
VRTLAAFLATALLSCQAGPAPSPSAVRPNIILIHADDLGWGDLSCYGQKRFATPNLDRMASEGTRFTDYYSGSTVCAPSRCSLLTGRHMGRAYIRGNAEIPLREGEVQVARRLKESGYATAVFGKWGLGLADNSGRPDLQGFDESFGYLDHKHAHRQYTDHLFRNGKRVEIAETEWANDLFTKESLGFIDRHRERPFFLYLAYTNPHAELRVPEDSMAVFRGRFEETPYKMPPPRPGYPGYRDQEQPRAAFAAMVTRMDRAVGEILARIKDAGLDGRTLVFFTSDNGPHREGGADPVFFDSNGPFKGHKRDLYEGGIRVPMIARWPGRIPAGRVSDFVWAHWDFFPTACELAGIAPGAEVDGISVAEALQGRPQKGHDSLYWEFFERGFDQAIRSGNWKGVRNGLGSPLELYDLKADPGEEKNLAGSNPDVVRNLEALMASARTDSERWVPQSRPAPKK